MLPLERTIRNKFIPALRGSHIWNGKERVLISLPTRYSGLAIPIFHESGETQFRNSSKIISELTASIKQRTLQYDKIEDNLKKLKFDINKLEEENYKNFIE